MPGTASIGQWALGSAPEHGRDRGAAELSGVRRGSAGAPAWPSRAGTGGTFVSGAARSLAAAQGCPCRWGDLQPSRALLHGRCLRWGFFFSR